MTAWRLLSTNASNIRDRGEFEPFIYKVRSCARVKKRLVRKRKPSLHAAAFDTEIIWSLQERSESKVTPNIDILSWNSNELESKGMSGR